MTHHVATIDAHTVFVTGPDAEALSKRMSLCLQRFADMPNDAIQTMPNSVLGLVNLLNATTYHFEGLQVIMARVVHAAQSDDDWAAVREGILNGMLKFDTKGMH